MSLMKSGTGMTISLSPETPLSRLACAGSLTRSLVSNLMDLVRDTKNKISLGGQMSVSSWTGIT